MYNMRFSGSAFTICWCRFIKLTKAQGTRSARTLSDHKKLTYIYIYMPHDALLQLNKIKTDELVEKT